MIHLAAFRNAASGGVAGTFNNLSAIADAFLTVNANNRFILPQPPTAGPSPWRIRFAYVSGVTANKARINNATLRQVGLPAVCPIAPSVSIQSLFSMPDISESGPRLPFADEFGLESDSTAVEVQNGFLWLDDGIVNRPAGQISALQGIATNAGSSTTLTTVANVWTPGNIVFDQGLPVGRYACVGLDVIGTSLLAARLVYPYAGPRPGCLGRASTAILSVNQFRYGNAGPFGEFTSYAQPQLEVFATTSAAIAFTVTLDLVKVA